MIGVMIILNALMALIRPGGTIKDITPSNTTDLPEGVTRGLWVGTTGDVQVTDMAGNITILNNMAEGMVHPLQVKRVWVANTTALNIKGIW